MSKLSTILAMLMFFNPSLSLANSKAPDKEQADHRDKTTRAVPFAGMMIGGVGYLNNLETGLSLRLEGGAFLLNNRLSVALGFTGILAFDSGSGTNSGLDSGSFNWSQTTRETGIGVFARYHHELAPGLSLSAGAGPQFLLRQVTVSGSSGSGDFGENEQSETSLAVLCMVSMEYSLGPGDLSLEANAGIGHTDGLVTGKSFLTGIGILLGYRLTF